MLKPGNIFIYHEKDIERYTIKLGDFGLSTFDDGSLHQSKVGTNMYASPEQKNEQAYDSRSDLYSLGIIIFELLYPLKTFMEKVKCIEEIRKNKFPSDISNFINFEIQEIISNLISDTPDSRPSIDKMLKAFHL